MSASQRITRDPNPTSSEERLPLTSYDVYDNDDYDRYAEYAEDFDPAHADRQMRRQRKTRGTRPTRKALETTVRALADPVGLEAGFHITYQPSKHERQWLLSSLEGFFDQHLITDIVSIVKGGKEASVYQCAAHPSTGAEWIAAKVYRPREFRNLRNDSLYRQGRQVLTGSGRPVKETDHRLKRALGKRTAFGEQVRHTSWLMYEYTTLQALHAAGAAVPQPYGVADNAILMTYCGDEGTAAPMLNTVQLEPDEAEPLFREALRSVEILLGQGLVHGDLSAYNILYWEGAITLIDFPQVTSISGNPHAYRILERDLVRLCEYFAAQGVRCDAAGLVADLWYRYGGGAPDLLLPDELE